MLRAILGVIVGYIVMVVLIVAGFTILQVALGTEAVYKPASWEPSVLFCVCAVVLGVAGALVGGAVCRAIGRSATPVMVLAGLTLVFGLLSAALQMGKPDPGPRPAEVTAMDSAQNARSPMWLNLANPIIGASGVMIGGGGLRKKKSAS